MTRGVDHGKAGPVHRGAPHLQLNPLLTLGQKAPLLQVLARQSDSEPCSVIFPYNGFRIVMGIWTL